MGKELAEVLVKEAGAAGEDSQGGIVTHRACGLLALLYHGKQDDFELLVAVTEGEQFGGEIGGNGRELRGSFGQSLKAILDPLAVRLFRGCKIFDVCVAE